MQVRFIPAFVVLLAAAITSIINIVYHVDMYIGLKRLLIVIILFYMIGLIAKVMLVKVITPKPKQEFTQEQENDPESNE